MIEGKPEGNEILIQLSKILRSQVLRDSEMLRNFLSFIVKESLNPDGILLKQYSIALHAFNRSPDFDPTTDPIVRIQASRLRRNLDIYYQGEGLADSVLITLPKGTYIPVFKYSGKKEADVPLETINSQEGIYSIAVKPLKNLSSKKKSQLIVDGFSEEILIELSRFSHLQVIRLAEDESQISSSSIARFYFEGSMRFGEKHVKIAVGVTDTFNNQIIWTYQEKIDIENCDLINIQELVATNVARQIAGINGLICKKLFLESNWEDIHSMQAYVTFTHYYLYDKNPTEKNANNLLEKLTKLVHKEPLFAPGWAVLANLHADAYALGLDKKNLENALSSAEKAIELQPNNQICQLYYGFSLMLDNRTEEAIIHFDKTIALNPNGIYYSGAAGWCFCMMGYLDKGYELVKSSIGIDFQYPKWFHMGTSLYFLDKKLYDKMLIEVNKMGHLDFHWTALLKLVAYYKLSQLEEAHKQLIILKNEHLDFIVRPKEYITCLVKPKVLSEKIFDAFEKVVNSQGKPLAVK